MPQAWCRPAGPKGKDGKRKGRHLIRAAWAKTAKECRQAREKALLALWPGASLANMRYLCHNKTQDMGWQGVAGHRNARGGCPHEVPLLR